MEKTKIRASGPAVFVINAFNSAGIGMVKPVCEKNKLVLEIDKRQKAEAFALMQRKNIGFEVVSERGAKTGAKKLFLHFGMWAGILAGLVLIFIYSAALLKIKVTGAERVPEAQIIEAAGLRYPALFAEIDTDEIEKKLVALDGISAASVVRKGTTVEITVTEELESPEIIDTTTPAPLLSSENGVVLKVVVVQGTAAVKAGDTVRKGDTLIEPYALDADGNRVPVRAMGEVVATVYLQRHVYYSDRMISTVRTGRTEQSTRLLLPGIEYQKPCDFVAYETETRTYKVSSILPFMLAETTYYETCQEETAFDFEANKARLVQENFDLLASSLPEDAVPVKWWFLTKRLDKNTVLSIYYQIERSVAVRPAK